MLFRSRTGRSEDTGLGVILKRTPGGQLVVRQAGNHSSAKQAYKWSPYSKVFRQVEKGGITCDTFELRDVPSEFLPQT